MTKSGIRSLMNRREFVVKTAAACSLICSGGASLSSEAFNPNIKLIRDKTLMQGHDCCNHRYVLKS